MGGENDLCARKPQSESPDDDVGPLLRPSIPRRVWPVAPARERESSVSSLGTPCMTKCTLAPVDKFDMVDLHTCMEPKVVGGG
jgi:hypothetical protein